MDANGKFDDDLLENIATAMSLFSQNPESDCASECKQCGDGVSLPAILVSEPQVLRLWAQPLKLRSLEASRPCTATMVHSATSYSESVSALPFEAVKKCLRERQPNDDGDEGIDI